MILILNINQKSAYFGVLVGIDASGKTSLLRRLQNLGICTENWTNLRIHQDTAGLAPNTPTAIKNRLSPLGRAMFIGGHIVAQYEYLVSPYLNTSKSVLLDSYYFKLLAKEIIYKKIDPVFFRLCQELPQPDITILIEVKPEESFRRKAGILSSYEYLYTPTFEDYISFQSELMALLEQYTAHVPRIKVDGMRPIDTVAKEIAEYLRSSGF